MNKKKSSRILKKSILDQMIDDIFDDFWIPKGVKFDQKKAKAEYKKEIYQSWRDRRT